MRDDLISVIDVSNHHGKRKQTVFKVLKRLGIEPKKIRSSTSRGQFIAYITQDEFHRVSLELQASSVEDELEQETDAFTNAEEGVFYLIQLEPDFDPQRFKLGFAASMSERLRALRCSAPFARVVRVWPCRRLWEKTAMDCISSDCERLHTEVFRAVSLDEVMAKCERFFAMMPVVFPLSEIAHPDNTIEQNDGDRFENNNDNPT
jgi:hypothetical protein